MSRHAIATSLLIGLSLFATTSTLAEDSKAKSPVPDQAAQAKSLEEVKSVLADDYAKLSRAQLSQKLLALGKASDSEPARQYVLFLEAAKSAVAGGDAATMADAVESLAAKFQKIDGLEMTARGLESIAKTCPKNQAASLLQLMLDCSTQAVEQDKYEVSQRLLTSAMAVARKAKAAELVQQIRNRQKELTDLANEHSTATAAIEKLKTDPTNEAANLAAGKYYAMTKGDWEKGATMLALGSDAPLKEAAALDLAGSNDSARQVVIGDKWWDLSAKFSGNAKAHLQTRAAYWYQQALPKIVDAFAKAKLDKRLADAARNPATIQSAPTVNSSPVEGEYELTSRLTRAPPNSAFQVGLEKKYRLFLWKKGRGMMLYTVGVGIYSPHTGTWEFRDGNIYFTDTRKTAFTKIGDEPLCLKVIKNGTSVTVEGVSTSPSYDANYRGSRVPDTPMGKDGQVVQGEYQLSVQEAGRNMSGPSIAGGDPVKSSLILCAGGTALFIVSTDYAHRGTWTINKNQVNIDFDQGRGKAFLTITKRNRSVELAGEHKGDTGNKSQWNAIKQ